MKQITLIPEDFDDLNTIRNYENNRDCPIARALKRQGIKNPYVHTNEYWDSPDIDRFNFPDKLRKTGVRINGDYDELERCANEIIAGAKEAYIEVL